MPRIPFEKIPKDLMGCMMQTENYVNSVSIIEHSLLELLRYRVSVINQCAYCIEMHFKEAVAAGESELRLYSSANWKDVEFYNDAEKSLLAWTESVTLLSDTTDERQQAYTTLSQHFNQEQIANLTLSIVQINAWTRLAKSFGFEAGHYQVGQH